MVAATPLVPTVLPVEVAAPPVVSLTEGLSSMVEGVEVAAPVVVSFVEGLSSVVEGVEVALLVVPVLGAAGVVTPTGTTEAADSTGVFTALIL